MKSHNHAVSSASISLLEILIAILIGGILTIVGMKTLTHIKKQSVSLNNFVLIESSIYETQIFINKYLEIAKKDSIIITNNKMEWESYSNLFKEGDNNGAMDFSFALNHCILELNGNNIYFNNQLLLAGVKTLSFSISGDILEYRICARHTCVDDFVILSDSEITL